MQCPYCREGIEEGSTKCPHCESALTGSTSNPATIKSCPLCKEEVRGNPSKCPSCDANLIYQRNETPIKIAAIALVCVLAYSSVHMWGASRRGGGESTEVAGSASTVESKPEAKPGSTNEPAQEAASSSSSASTSSAPSEPQKGDFSVKATSGVFVSSELKKYEVKVRKTNNLDGTFNYGSPKEHSASRGFFGEEAQFSYMEYGYYEISFAGYNDYGHLALSATWKNIKFDCKWARIELQQYGNPIIDCF